MSGDQIPSLLGRKRSQMPGVCPGGGNVEASIWLVHKPEIWIIDLSSAIVGMLMSSSKLFLFSQQAYLNSRLIHTYPDIFENEDFFPYLKKIGVHKNTIDLRF